jgi:hypothetical protein
LFNGKGLPEENEVKEYLSWGCWQVNDKLSLKLLQIFSAMNHGKGLPKEEASIVICHFPGPAQKRANVFM